MSLPDPFLMSGPARALRASALGKAGCTLVEVACSKVQFSISFAGFHVVGKHVLLADMLSIMYRLRKWCLRIGRKVTVLALLAGEAECSRQRFYGPHWNSSKMRLC
jgi:hypothetical protein